MKEYKKNDWFTCLAIFYKIFVAVKNNEDVMKQSLDHMIPKHGSVVAKAINSC